MINEIIENLKKSVKDSIIDKEIIIPWINESTEVITLKEILDFLRIPFVFPPIVDPEIEISEKDEELDKEIYEYGIEALAWYISFHRSSKWGIYFRVRGLFYLSNLFKTKNNLNDINCRIKIAFEVLFYHEFFHFLTDLTAATMEMIYKKPIYNNYFDSINIVIKNAPVKLLHQCCNPNAEGFILIEEPLANAYVLKRTSKNWHYKIKRFFDKQPIPYDKYYYFTDDYTFLKGKRKLGLILTNSCKINHINNLNDLIVKFMYTPKIIPFWEFLFNADPEKLFLPQIPIYFVFEGKYSSDVFRLSIISDGVKIAVYPCDHPPPHLHIWIPIDSKREIKCLYPSLEPYKGYRSLSTKEKKKIMRIIEQNKDKIEKRINKMK